MATAKTSLGIARWPGRGLRGGVKGWYKSVKFVKMVKFLVSWQRLCPRCRSGRISKAYGVPVTSRYHCLGCGYFGGIKLLGLCVSWISGR